MRAAALSIAALAGCAGEGIYLEVRPPADLAVTEVELFLGYRDCTLQTPDGKKPCERMQPAGFDRPEPAAVYFAQPERLVAPLTDGAARFRFAPEAKTLPVAIAIAFANNQPVAVGTIEHLDLADEPLHVILDQSRPQQLTQADVPGNEPRLALWGKDDVRRCVGTQLANNTLAFVVPETDPDCDGVAMECDPLGYLATRPGGRVCVDAIQTTSGEACMLGGVPCREDPSAPAPACVPDAEPFCIPQLACSCGEGDLACLETKLAGGGTARMSCTFATQPNPANPNERIPCTDGPGAAPARLDYDVLQLPLDCPAPPDLGPLALPLSLGSELTLGGQTIRTADFNQLPCGIGFEWRGVVTAATPARLDALVALHVTSARPVAKRRHVLLPLDVGFTLTCQETQTCELAAESELDLVWNCAR